MSGREEELRLRKRLLQARSALYRLKIQREAGALRESLSWRRAARVMVRSPVARSAGFGLALEVLGPGRMARLVAFASRVLMAARVANIVLMLLRRRTAEPREEQSEVRS
jgi:hypothetical protein